jgi:hypothetical protein
MRARISGQSRSKPVPYYSEFDPADRILLVIILLVILEGEHVHHPYFTGGYGLGGLVSTASAAESFRSRCGSVRGAPVCSSQTSSLVAPQVGQGTDNICLRVRSFVFTATGYRLPQFENCSISDTFALRRVSEFFMGPPPMWQL